VSCLIFKANAFAAGVDATTSSRPPRWRRHRGRWFGLVLGLAGFVAVLSKGTAAEVESPRPAGAEGGAGPPFSVAEQEGRWSLFTPAGQPFFSMGVCVVTPGVSRAIWDSENPAYAWWRYYTGQTQWADATLRRLKEWRFTTLGAWSDHATLRASKEMTLHLTPVLHLGSTAGAPWWDMWDSRIVDRMDEVARSQVLAVRDDPKLLGYYSDNELGWWNATLFKMTLEQPASSGQRKRLLRLLRETYGNDWNRLRQDFEPEHAEGWRQLEKSGMLFLKPGGDGIRVMRRFLALLADRYYQLAREIIRKYDPRGLYLGDRYQSFYYPEVARAAGRYVDAISSNLNASWNDGTFPRSYLETLHALSGKPILVSEVYMAAAENRSGNRNSMGVYPVVNGQSERVSGLRNTLEALARNPVVLGVDWFQFYDQPRHGREDGENYNFGLVDLEDRPYDELTSFFASWNPSACRLQNPVQLPDASEGVPPAPSNPFAEFEATRALKHWDRERGFVKPVTREALADLYLCWNAHGLYLGLYALDIIEEAYYRGRSVPKQDRPLWQVRVVGAPPFHVRLGAGREPVPSTPGPRIEHLSALNLNVRTVTALELPAAWLGREKLQAGDVIEFDAVLTSHARAYRTTWKGRFILREAATP
jgi:hypothetical protein